MSLDTGTNEAEDLAKLGLNCLIRQGNCDPAPAVFRDGKYYDARGLRLADPDYSVPLNPQELSAYMRANKIIYVNHLMPIARQKDD